MRLYQRGEFVMFSDDSYHQQDVNRVWTQHLQDQAYIQIENDYEAKARLAHLFPGSYIPVDISPQPSLLGTLLKRFLQVGSIVAVAYLWNKMNKQQQTS
jgi:hypothetical protein